MVDDEYDSAELCKDRFVSSGAEEIAKDDSSLVPNAPLLWIAGCIISCIYIVRIYVSTGVPMI